MKYIALLMLLSQLSYSYEMKILNWYRLDRSNNMDMTAEVCFKLTPSPKNPIPVNITVDKNRKSEAYYMAWIGSKGSTCHVVSTQRGRVEVETPKLKLKDSRDKFFSKN
ncbi:hypothetical protein N9N67_00310 [Bacteriovoracaceae bacterium]|nr:hypothetical protein [Bacteriovoracaceae bacterium]